MTKFRITKKLFAEWLGKTRVRFYTTCILSHCCPITKYARAHGLPGATSAFGKIRDGACRLRVREDWIADVHNACDDARPTTGKQALKLLREKGIL